MVNRANQFVLIVDHWSFRHSNLFFKPNDGTVISRLEEKNVLRIHDTDRDPVLQSVFKLVMVT